MDEAARGYDFSGYGVSGRDINSEGLREQGILPGNTGSIKRGERTWDEWN